MKKHALSRAMLSVKDDALRAIVSAYTREAGVRNLEREAATICRKAAVRYLDTGKKSTVTGSNLSAYLGPPKFLREQLPETDQVGIANGLAYTSVGGELLFVEVNVMPGAGKLELTGSLGDVMKESAKAAMSYIRTRTETLHIDPNFYNTKDIHIHVPEGAIPKDGPSAGVTIACALIFGADGPPFPARPGHDRRDHAARSRPAHRRPAREDDGGHESGRPHRGAAAGKTWRTWRRSANRCAARCALCPSRTWTRCWTRPCCRRPFPMRRTCRRIPGRWALRRRGTPPASPFMA